MTNNLTIEQVEKAWRSKSSVPPAAKVVMTLQEKEKTQKKLKNVYSVEQLVGTWRLFFITGTKKAQSRVGIALGKGQYLPQFLKIHLTYRSLEMSSLQLMELENSVTLGPLKITLIGPAKFLSSRNIMAFDFNKIQIKIWSLSIYNGTFNTKGKEEAEFADLPISKQAFFTYFFAKEEVIAARGKGGGLAIWSRVNDK